MQMQMNQQPTSQSNTPQPIPTSDSQGMVTKCVRFFKTLIQLSQQPEQQQPSQNPQQTAHLVKELVSVCCTIIKFSTKVVTHCVPDKLTLFPFISVFYSDPRIRTNACRGVHYKIAKCLKIASSASSPSIPP